VSTTLLKTQKKKKKKNKQKKQRLRKLNITYEPGKDPCGEASRGGGGVPVIMVRDWSNGGGRGQPLGKAWGRADELKESGGPIGGSRKGKKRRAKHRTKKLSPGGRNQTPKKVEV